MKCKMCGNCCRYLPNGLFKFDGILMEVTNNICNHLDKKTNLCKINNKKPNVCKNWICDKETYLKKIN